MTARAFRRVRCYQGLDTAAWRCVDRPTAPLPPQGVAVVSTGLICHSQLLACPRAVGHGRAQDVSRRGIRCEKRGRRSAGRGLLRRPAMGHTSSRTIRRGASKIAPACVWITESGGSGEELPCSTVALAPTRPWPNLTPIGSAAARPWGWGGSAPQAPPKKYWPAGGKIEILTPHHRHPPHGI